MIVCAALAASGFVPISYLGAPIWVVLVVDERGQPLEGITVRLTYQNYSAEPMDHRQDLITDSRGLVEFPSHAGSCSIAQYVWLPFSLLEREFMRVLGGTQAFSRLVKDARGVPSTMASLPIGLDRLAKWNPGLQQGEA